RVGALVRGVLTSGDPRLDRSKSLLDDALEGETRRRTERRRDRIPPLGVCKTSAFGSDVAEHQGRTLGIVWDQPAREDVGIDVRVSDRKRPDVVEPPEDASLIVVTGAGDELRLDEERHGLVEEQVRRGRLVHLRSTERLPYSVATIEPVQVGGESAERLRDGIVRQEVDGTIERLLGRAQVLEAARARRRTLGSQIHLERAQVELGAAVVSTVLD